jgi:uncharacterized repeat protein (TIGR02543 family)
LAKNPYIPINPDTTPGITDTSTGPTGNGSPTIYTATVTTVNCTVNTVMTSPNVYTFEVIPQPGYIFTGWSGANTSTDNPLSLTLTNNINLTATCGATWNVIGDPNTFIDMLHPEVTAPGKDVIFYANTLFNNTNQRIRLLNQFETNDFKVYLSNHTGASHANFIINCKWPIANGSYSAIDLTLQALNGPIQIECRVNGILLEMYNPSSYDYTQLVPIGTNNITFAQNETKTIRFVKKTGSADTNIELRMYNTGGDILHLQKVKTFDREPNTTYPSPWKSRVLYPSTISGSSTKDGYTYNFKRYFGIKDVGAGPIDFNPIPNWILGSKVFCSHTGPTTEQKAFNVKTGGLTDTIGGLTQANRIWCVSLAGKNGAYRTGGATNDYSFGGNDNTTWEGILIIDNSIN